MAAISDCREFNPSKSANSCIVYIGAAPCVTIGSSKGGVSMSSITFNRAQVYPFMRDFQSRFGFLLGLKVFAQREARRFLRKPFEAEFALVKALEGESGDFLDVGANRGQSIDAIKLFCPEARVTAFEPNALLAERLKKYFRRDHSVDVISAGLSDRAGEHQLYIPFYRGFMYDGLASFDYSEAYDWLNPQTVWHFQRDKLNIRSCSCELKTLDNCEFEPVMLKIDVQGNERAVLAGSKRTLEVYKPLIILENNPEAHAWLTERGWRFHAFCDGRLIAANKGENNTVYLFPGSPLERRVLSLFG